MPAAETELLSGDIFQDDAILDREICRRSLHEFIKHFWSEMDPGVYVDGWHIGAICEHLQAVSTGQIKRLIINIPPRHMKSLTTSVAWPAWTWAQDPDPALPLLGPAVRFLSLSYAFNLSVRDSRKSRILLQSQKYRRYWGDRVQLAGDQNAKARFENTEKGYRLASSVEGMATGEGGDIDIIDDPLSAKDKESPVSRAGVIEWWTQVMPTRLNDPVHGAFVIIMQRLHHQDLTGHVLAQETGWTHLCLPARYEPDHPHVFPADPRKKSGALLWAERFPEKEVAALEMTMGAYGSAGQLQQRPAPRQGGMFERTWFEIVPAAPAKARAVRGWDLAGTTKKTSPWTVGLKMSHWKGDYYIEHVERFRGTPGEVEKRFKNRAKQDGKSVIVDFPQDPGQAGKSQRRALTKLLPGYNVRSSPETGSKPTRAEPLSAQAEAGNVHLVKGAWNNDLLDEFELFPNSDYLDQVDAASRAFARLAIKEIKVGGGGFVVNE